MKVSNKGQRKAKSQQLKSGADSHVDQKTEDWYAIALTVKETLEQGTWRKDFKTSIEWLKKYAKESGYSTNTLRRLGKLTAFVDHLIKTGIVTETANVNKLSHTKLEIVSRIWSLSPDKAHELASQMLANAASRRLRNLRGQYQALRLLESSKLKPRGTAQVSSRTDVAATLRGIYKIPDIVGQQTLIAIPGAQAFSLVSVDAVLGCIIEQDKQDKLAVNAAILVVRSNEVINKATSLSFLAKICYVASFFKNLWIVGKEEDFPELPRKEDEQGDKIHLLAITLAALKVRNVGIIEALAGDQKIRASPDASPQSSNDHFSDRLKLVDSVLPLSLFRRISSQVADA
jgi:hypothetical protein